MSFKYNVSFQYGTVDSSQKIMNLVLSLIVPVFGTNATKFDALIKIGETEIRGTNAILENKILED